MKTIKNKIGFSFLLFIIIFLPACSQDEFPEEQELKDTLPETDLPYTIAGTNLAKVTTVERFRIVFDDKVRIPVSDNYKEPFQEFIDKNFMA